MRRQEAGPVIPPTHLEPVKSCKEASVQGRSYRCILGFEVHMDVERVFPRHKRQVCVHDQYVILALHFGGYLDKSGQRCPKARQSSISWCKHHTKIKPACIPQNTSVTSPRLALYDSHFVETTRTYCATQKLTGITQTASHHKEQENDLPAVRQSCSTLPRIDRRPYAKFRRDRKRAGVDCTQEKV